MALLTHRHTAYRLLPPWARRFNLFSVIYAGALVLDALADALMAAVKIRLGAVYSDEGLPRTGSERKIYRGPNEGVDSYVARLSQWWDVGKRTGDFLTIARELQNYALPTTYEVAIVTNDGHRYTLSTTGTWTIESVPWNWDGQDLPSRFWVLLTNTALAVTGTDHVVLDAGASVLQAGRSVGSDTPYLNVVTSPTPDPKELQRRLEVYRPPHMHCEHIMLLLDPVAFWASPPAGNWQLWANRNDAALYWTGTIAQ